MTQRPTVAMPRRARRPLLALLATALLLLGASGCEDKASQEQKSESASGAAQAPAPEALELVDADHSALQQAIKDAGASGKKAVLVNAWATWCAPCIEEFPDLVKLSRDYADKGLQVYFVSADEPDVRPDVVKFLTEQGVTGKSFLKAGDDEAFINGLDPEWDGSLPATFVFDAAGKRVVSLREPASYEGFVALVEPVLAGRAASARKAP